MNILKEHIYNCFITLKYPKIIGRVWIILSLIFLLSLVFVNNEYREKVLTLIVYIMTSSLSFIYLTTDIMEHEFDSLQPFSPCLNCGVEKNYATSKYCIINNK